MAVEVKAKVVQKMAVIKEMVEAHLTEMVVEIKTYAFYDDWQEVLMTRNWTILTLKPSKILVLGAISTHALQEMVLDSL